MKNIKRWIAVLLCMACIFALTACAGKAEKLVGRWGASGKLSEELSEAYWEFTEYGTFLITDKYGNTAGGVEGTYSAEGNQLTLHYTEDNETRELNCKFDMIGRHLTIFVEGQAIRLVRK